MESVLFKMRKNHIQALAQVRWLQCESLVEQFENATAVDERSRIAQSWDRTMKEIQSMRHMLDLLEQSQRQMAAHS